MKVSGGTHHFLGGTSRICGGKCKGQGANEAITHLRAALDNIGGCKKLKMASAFQTPLSSQSNVVKSATESSQPKPPSVTNASPKFQVGSTRTRHVNLVAFVTQLLQEDLWQW